MAEITLQQANTIITRTLEKGREMELAPLAVVVLDTGGHPRALARDDGAGFLRHEIASAKAWGSLGMGAGSRALASRVGAGDGARAFMSALFAVSGGRAVPSPGGVLVCDGDGTVIGAVGVSGDTGDNDETCALAGIEAAGLVADTG